MVMSRLVTAAIVLYAALSGLYGCAEMPPSSPVGASNVGGGAAEGVFVRRMRIRVTPFQIEKFEALIHRCVRAAEAAGLTEEYDWLVYREPPARYWLIVFGETVDGFAAPDSFASFARHVARAEGPDALDEINVMLTSVEVEIEEKIVNRQYAAWSTVGGMTTATHPKARVVEYTIRRGAGEAFSRALAARTVFLKDHGYVLPIEGFVVLRGASWRATQVVFPVNWSDFHRSNSVDAFVAGLSAPAATEFRELDRALNETISKIEHYDGDFASELSYSAP